MLLCHMVLLNCRLGEPVTIVSWCNQKMQVAVSD
jgi:hypothetical protein